MAPRLPLLRSDASRVSGSHRAGGDDGGRSLGVQVYEGVCAGN